MAHQHSGKEDIVPTDLAALIIIYRQGKTHIIPIPPVLSVLLMLLFRILRILPIRSDLNQLRYPLRRIGFSLCNSAFQGNPTL